MQFNDVLIKIKVDKRAKRNEIKACKKLMISPNRQTVSKCNRQEIQSPKSRQVSRIKIQMYTKNNPERKGLNVRHTW